MLILVVEMCFLLYHQHTERHNRVEAAPNTTNTKICTQLFSAVFCTYTQ